MQEIIDSFTKLNNELREFVISRLRNIPLTEVRFLYGAFVLTKAINTNQSIILLCKEGYGEDALMLDRTLLELMISCLYILQDTTGQELTRYNDHGWILQNKAYNYFLNSTPLGDDLKKKIESGSSGLESIESVAQRTKELKEKYGKDFGGNEWSKKSIAEMAEAVDVKYLYNTVYRLQCMSSHASVGSIPFYLKRTEDGLTAGIGPNLENVDLVLINAFECFLRIVLEINQLLSWNLNSELEGFTKRFMEELSKHPNSLQNSGHSQ